LVVEEVVEEFLLLLEVLVDLEVVLDMVEQKVDLQPQGKEILVDMLTILVQEEVEVEQVVSVL
jgi:rRNA-processing protein FCF1